MALKKERIDILMSETQIGPLGAAPGRCRRHERKVWLHRLDMAGHGVDADPRTGIGSNGCSLASGTSEDEGHEVDLMHGAAQNTVKGSGGGWMHARFGWGQPMSLRKAQAKWGRCRLPLARSLEPLRDRQ